jgi:hypothetical protein
LVLTLSALDSAEKVINRMPNFEIDVSELDPAALAVLRAALAYARKNPETKTHVLPLRDFFDLVGFGDEVYIMNFLCATSDVKRVATYSQDYEPEVLRAWTVFDTISVSNTDIQFSVNEFAMNASESS